MSLDPVPVDQWYHKSTVLWRASERLLHEYLILELENNEVQQRHRN